MLSGVVEHHATDGRSIRRSAEEDTAVGRTLLVAAIGIALATPAVTPVDAAQTRAERTSVPTDCHHLAVRPRSIVFACADGGFSVRRLTWSSWHRFRASGRGVFHQNDCRPNCAEGAFHTAAGSIELRRRMVCGQRPRFVFRRVVIVFDHPLLHRDRVSFRLRCP
jgi:hypothetical protein